MDIHQDKPRPWSPDDPSPLSGRPPWFFHTQKYGLGHVVCDSDGRVLVSHVQQEVGLLMSGAPTMYAVLKIIAAERSEGDRHGDLARRALRHVDEHDEVRRARAARGGGAKGG